MAVLFLTLYLSAILGGCSALSLRINSGYRSDASTTNQFHDNIPPPTDFLHGIIISRNIWWRFQPVDNTRYDDDEMNVRHKFICNEREAANNMLRSIALVTSCRRLSFLIISIALMNFVRSTILKASRNAHVLFYTFTDILCRIILLLSLTFASNPTCNHNRYPRVTERCSINARGRSRYSTIRSNSFVTVQPTWLFYGESCVFYTRVLRLFRE